MYMSFELSPKERFQIQYYEVAEQDHTIYQNFERDELQGKDKVEEIEWKWEWFMFFNNFCYFMYYMCEKLHDNGVVVTLFGCKFFE